MSAVGEEQQTSQESLYRYKRISQWDCDDVSTWMDGLHEGLSKHVPQFIAHSISGNDLLKLSRQQLVYLKVNQIGHQELLLEAVELLASVDNSRSRQTTISLSSNLSKKTSQLVKAISSVTRKGNEEDYSSCILECMEMTATVLQAAKYLIGWLDRYPTELIENYQMFRKSILNCTFQLSSVTNSDDLDIEKMSSACTTILKLTSGLMSPELLSKADPVTMVTVTLIPDEEKGLGFSIQRTRRGALVISQVQNGSPADRCSSLTEGVELIQINDQNVVSWDVRNVVKCLKASGHEVVLTLRVSSNKGIDSFNGSQEVLNEPNGYPPTTRRLKPKPGNLSLALERVSSSPSLLKGDRRPPLTSPMSPDVGERGRVWERYGSHSIHSATSEDSMRQKSHSLSDSLNQDSSGRFSVTSPESAIKPVIAYRTEIIGGVVHRVPIQPLDDLQGVAGVKTNKKGGSLRKKQKRKERSSSLSGVPIGRMSSDASVITPTSPLVTTPTKLNPQSTNEGGEVEFGKAIFSDPTDIIIEGKTTKQVTVSSGVESSKFNRDNVLRLSGKKTNPDLLVPCFQLKDANFEGWVCKLGGSGLTPKNWRRRWFVLKDGRIYYYKTSFDISALGVIDLNGYTVEQELDSKKKNAFKISKPGARTYYFYTDTAEEMLRWMDVMTQASSITVDSSQTVAVVPSTESFDDEKSESED